MDMRSFGLNYEITLMSAEGSLLEKMTALAGEYREACTELTSEEWDTRARSRRYIDNVARLTSALQ
jgi:cardiolipin synthase